MNLPTPRTDELVSAIAEDAITEKDKTPVASRLIEFAMQLERELAAAQSDRDAARKLNQDAQRLNWLEQHLFSGRWDGTIGRPKTWSMAGPYRHTMQRMQGSTLREAIDAAMSVQGGDSVHSAK